MDGRGRAKDYIFIERLWRSVKQENIYLNAYENGNELYTGLTVIEPVEIRSILNFTTRNEAINISTWDMSINYILNLVV